MKSIIALYADDTIAAQSAQDLIGRGIPRDNVRVVGNPTDPGFARVATDELKARGVPEDRRVLYVEAVRRGGALVIADTVDELAEDSAAILDARGSIDLDRTAERWRAAGWTPEQAQVVPYYQGEERQRERELLAGETFDVVEEQVRIGKREVERGGLRVRSYITEHPVSETVRLREERVNVTREPAAEPISAREAEAAFSERSTEVEVTATAEEPVVERRAQVVERVHVEKEAEEHVEEIEDTERRRDIEVERVEPPHPGR